MNMKKMLTFALAALLALSMAACGTDAAPETPVTETNIPATSAPIPTEQEESIPADGEYHVALNEAAVIYDQNGIRVTYKSAAMDNFGLNLIVEVENRSTENLHFVPYGAVVNGMTFSASYWEDEPMALNETRECTVYIELFDTINDYRMELDAIRCLDLHYGFYAGENIYGAPQTLIANNLSYCFTKGQHDHRNDQRQIFGELVYESSELAIYMERNFRETSDKYYSRMTVINKTNRTISLGGVVECRYNVAPARPHYTTLVCMPEQVAAHSYVSSIVYLEEEWSGLDMTQLILSKQCYYATWLDHMLTEDDCIDENGIEGLEKMDCFYDRITVSVTVEKSDK